MRLVTRSVTHTGPHVPRLGSQPRGWSTLPWKKAGLSSERLLALILGAGHDARPGRRTMVLKGVGGVIFALGVFLFCGNVFRFFPTAPFAGYITMAIGGALFR